MNVEKHAPGQPGIDPRWTSSAKSGVGTACNQTSTVWFTLSHGIINEVYHPHVDWACIRDMGLIVSDGGSFVSEEKRATHSEVRYLSDGVPAYHLINTCKDGRYRIEKKIIVEPKRNVVLQWTRFTPLKGALRDYRLYVLLAPHLGNQGADNSAWLGDYKGRPLLYAQHSDTALALASSVPWRARSVGYVGTSDGWQDIRQHGQLTTRYERAEQGNVALTGEIDLLANDGEFILALSLAGRPAAAGHHANASLLGEFSDQCATYIQQWQDWQARLEPLEDADFAPQLYRISTAVMQTHEAKHFPGAMIASLSIPWGASKGDHDLGGYHLVWSRDLVESVGGLIAAGAHSEARRVLHYLHATQNADGSWSQNMWLDGQEYWRGIQLDEIGFPILLTAQAWRAQTLSAADVAHMWPMIDRALRFLLQNGPCTGEDRWEEKPGYSPFTLAVVISALLAAAELADLQQQPDLARYLRETADIWNDTIEAWLYVSDTDLARAVGVDGYYIRLAPPDPTCAIPLSAALLPLNNYAGDRQQLAAAEMISPDALALVRFGLRAADDPRIRSTVKAIDAQLKLDTPKGPCWHRYTCDGYGEHRDGTAFDGTGIGRAWPLLTGERAHYEIACGNIAAARSLLHTLEEFAGAGGMLPEQIWDSADIPQHELYFACPSGSAMPLVWAHAEYIKLCRSLRAGKVFDMPPLTAQRYLVDQPACQHWMWRFSQRWPTMPSGRLLRIETHAAATLRWTSDGWQSWSDCDSTDTGMGIHVTDLPTAALAAGTHIEWTFHWTAADRWEGRNFSLVIGDYPARA